MTTRSGSPQSRQGKSTVTALPGNSQPTASDSNAHWPNHFCCPSMVIRYCVGRLLKGAKDTMWSVRGYSQPGIPEEKRSCVTFRPSSTGKPEFRGKLCVKGRLPGFYHTFHDDVKRLFEHWGCTHGISSFIILVFKLPVQMKDYVCTSFINSTDVIILKRG